MPSGFVFLFSFDNGIFNGAMESVGNAAKTSSQLPLRAVSLIEYNVYTMHGTHQHRRV